MNTQDCITSAKSQIFDQWLVKTRVAVPAASGQSKPALVNSLSAFLDHLIEMLKETNSAASDLEYKHLASGHGVQRAKVGSYTLLQINTEFILLQEVVFSVLRDCKVQVSVDDAKTISLCFQTAVAESGSAFVDAIDEARERSEIQFRLLVQEATDYAIFMVDPGGVITSWNEGAERMKQYSSKEAIGQNFSMLYREEDRTEMRPERNLRQALETGRHEEQWWRRKKDGTVFWADTVMTSVRTKRGELLGFSKIVRDLTSKKRTEDELRAAKVSAEDANSLKTIFVANMSHEIRTPLGAILGFSEILRDIDGSQQDRNLAAEAIERNGKSLLRLIEDILDISKIEAGKLEVEIGEVTIRALLKDIVSLFEKRASEKGISLNLQIDSDVPGHICSDQFRLGQILSNVIGNAVKFTEQGEVTIQVHYYKVNDQPSGLEFIVTDTGAGLTDAERNGLFAPFSQADSTATRKFGGTGLGLALSRRLAIKLGGDVVLLDEKIRTGCSFKVTVADLKASKSENIKKRGLASKAMPGRTQPSRNIKDEKVLVVDDSKDNRVLIQVLLRKWGIECDFAGNGAEAVLIAMNGSYDLILMDIQMPVLDGNQAMKQLRSSGYQGQIVALTAHAMSEERSKAYDAGCDDYLVKPIDKARLLEVLENCAKESNAE